MTLNGVMHMYGNKPPIYAFSLCVLCFGIGWLVAGYEEMGFTNFLLHTIGLLTGVFVMDAFIKSIIFVKEHFNISITRKK